MKEPKKPLIENISETFKGTEINTDKTMRHFLLAGFLLVEASAEALSAFYPGLKKDKTKLIESLKNEGIRSSLELQSENDLRKSLQGLELINNLSKQQLIDVIISNPVAMNKLRMIERQSSLKKKTNQELKKLLLGQSGISQLKKSQLVERVLSIEFNE